MRCLFTLFCFLISLSLTAQDSAKLEKNITGAQIGFLGMDVYSEFALNDSFSLRAEASLLSTVFGGSEWERNNWVFYPGFSVQPRYYYNLNRRLEKGKYIQNNSGNYLMLKLEYLPDWFVLNKKSNSSNYYSNYHVLNQIQIIPTYGLRRNFANQFNYEANFGIGYNSTIGYSKNRSDVAVQLSLKIGLDFLSKK